MNLYETTFIARQDISASDVEKLTDDFVNIVVNMGGKLHKKEYWGLRNLAYIIKKNRKAHYTMLILEASDEAMKEMERVMSINEDLLRQVSFRIKAVPDKPSPMATKYSKEEEQL
jgi:small subunit ribosomal protein S6